MDNDLTKDFEAACNDPQNFDFGFTKQREKSGFANFGFDPKKAAELRGEIPTDDDYDLGDDDYQDDDTPLDDLGDDDDYYDRFSDPMDIY